MQDVSQLSLIWWQRIPASSRLGPSRDTACSAAASIRVVTIHGRWTATATDGTCCFQNSSALNPKTLAARESFAELHRRHAWRCLCQGDKTCPMSWLSGVLLTPTVNAASGGTLPEPTNHASNLPVNSKSGLHVYTKTLA